MNSNSEFYTLSTQWVDLISRRDYAHNLSFYGTKIFQVPTDIYLYQKLIWDVKPTLVIETGVAKGGSILAVASFMFLARQSMEFRTMRSDEKAWAVIGVDKNNLESERSMLNNWSFADKIHLIEGSSTDPVVEEQVQSLTFGHSTCIVFLDSDHSELHVERELEIYSQFVSVGSYIVVFDSGIGRLSAETHMSRPRGWSQFSHAGTAVGKFIEKQEAKRAKDFKAPYFKIVSDIAEPLGISSIENGILRRES